jgi:pyruvate dehydrogenase E1 component
VQHQDGHSHLIASTIPNLISYDPSFAYELALIVREGIKRMYEDGEDIFYYLTVTNQNYPMPPLPDEPEVSDQVLKGMYCFEREPNADVNLFGSGAVMVEVLDAAQELRSQGLRVNIWSVTSYTELARDALAVERRNLLSAGEEAESSFLETLLGSETGVFVAASDYQKSIALGISPWIRNPYTVLGTDGFGLSEARDDLRSHFEVSAHWIVFATLSTLAANNYIPAQKAKDYAASVGLDLAKNDPARD